MAAIAFRRAFGISLGLSEASIRVGLAAVVMAGALQPFRTAGPAGLVAGVVLSTLAYIAALFLVKAVSVTEIRNIAGAVLRKRRAQPDDGAVAEAANG
jgi:hypothetical protein